MILYFLSFILTYYSQAQTTNTNACQTRCAGDAPVQIDVAAQCMCVAQRKRYWYESYQSYQNSIKCFKVGIGHDGASMTDSGEGKLKPTPPGIKYQTFPTDSVGYDRDAIAMGIDGNDVVGKWIHKPARCVNAETYRTKGCIAVPCDMWPMLKEAMRNEAELTVCNGHTPGTPRMRPNSRFNEETQSIEK